MFLLSYLFIWIVLFYVDIYQYIFAQFLDLYSFFLHLQSFTIQIHLCFSHGRFSRVWFVVLREKTLEVVAGVVSTVEVVLKRSPVVI